MTLHVTQLESRAEHRSFRLSRPAAPVTSEVRDDVVLPADTARAVLTAAGRKDVSSGGAYSPGPAALLGTVLGLAGAQVAQHSAASAAIPLPRDPFRSSSWATPALTGRATNP